MRINIERTVDNVLNRKHNSFKRLAEDEGTGSVTLSTPVDDAFNRDIIVVEHDKISVGVQGLDEEAKLVTLFSSVPVNILQCIEFIDKTENSKVVK